MTIKYIFPPSSLRRQLHQLNVRVVCPSRDLLCQRQQNQVWELCPNVHCLQWTETQLIFTVLAHGHPGKGDPFWFLLLNFFVQVSLIVMITRLVEKNKLKAHQYWPDDTDETEIGPEIKVSWPTHKFLLRLVLSGGWRSQDLPSLLFFPRFLLPQVSQS